MSMKERETVLLEALHSMEEIDQEKLVAFASMLWKDRSSTGDLERIKESLRGLPPFDAEEIERIIEEGCERVYPEEWEPPQFTG